jgi:hypothetical protein
MTRMTRRALADQPLALLTGLFVSTAALCGGCTGPAIQPIGDLGAGMVSDLAGLGPDAFFRLGHFIVGLAPFDICIKGPSDSDFSGPLMRLQAQRVGGVPYASISMYLTVAATGYTVRTVPGSSTDCMTKLGGVPDLQEPPLAVGQHYTVLASGDLSRLNTLKFGLLEDDLSSQGGQARLRFINASPDLPNADLGFGADAQYMPQITGALYGGYGLATGKPYLTTAPLNNVTVSVRQGGVNTDAFTNKISVAAGGVATSVIGGIPGDQYTPLSLVLCNDTAPAAGGFSSCIELP